MQEEYAGPANASSERWVALALSPYLVWVMIATALQSSITWLNR
jgi:tryptophan-rich sensory protein